MPSCTRLCVAYPEDSEWIAAVPVRESKLHRAQQCQLHESDHRDQNTAPKKRADPFWYEVSYLIPGFDLWACVDCKESRQIAFGYICSSCAPASQKGRLSYLSSDLAINADLTTRWRNWRMDGWVDGRSWYGDRAIASSPNPFLAAPRALLCCTFSKNRPSEVNLSRTHTSSIFWCHYRCCLSPFRRDTRPAQAANPGWSSPAMTARHT